MPNRPDPSPIPALDAKALRRDMKLMLPPTLLLDHQEWTELQDFTGQTARHNVIRKAILAATPHDGPHWRTLRPEERTALALFILGEGPRPAFLPAVPLTSPAPTPWPVEDPTEPGRYVQPSGRFAVPAAPDFQPDRR